MNKALTTISLVLLAGAVSGQGLFLPESVQLKVGSAASLSVGGDLTNTGQIYDEGLLVVSGTVDNSSRLNISNNSGSTVPTLQANGNVINTGNLENVGLIRLGGSWSNTGIYNGIAGEIEFDGMGDQQFSNSVVDLNTLTINSGGTTTITGDTVRVLGQIDFVNGYLDVEAGAYLIIESEASVLGGSVNSYSIGKLHQRGQGYKFYPVGNDEYYLPVYLEQIYGQALLMGVQVGAFPNPPTPDRLLESVSGNYFWDLETVSGRFDSSQVTVDYLEANLLNSPTANNIAYEEATPVLAESESLSEPFTSLFTTDPSIDDPDLFSSGMITSETGFSKRYLAVALSPKIPEDGVSYIPNAFSPLSINPEDRVLKFYGEKVVPEEFSFKIYDRYGKVMYETTDLDHAKTTGWDGFLPNGKEAPSGYYFYSAKFAFLNGRRVSKTGDILLIK